MCGIGGPEKRKVLGTSPFSNPDPTQSIVSIKRLAAALGGQRGEQPFFGSNEAGNASGSPSIGNSTEVVTLLSENKVDAVAAFTKVAFRLHCRIVILVLGKTTKKSLGSDINPVSPPYILQR